MIKIDHLKFSYSKKKHLFDDLSLSVDGGTIIGLLGKNGAGKSTLLRIINGLLIPQQGACEVFGLNSKLNSPEMLNDIFFMPEEFYVPAISIRQYVNVYRPFYTKFDGDQFDGFLKEFSLEWDDKLSSLSHGQKKKFYLGFGLACNTRLCILDEPTNGLDIPSKSQFRKIVASTLTEDRTIIVSTHQVRDVENLIDRVLILDEGKIIFNQATEEISERLLFYHSADPRNTQKVLYSEGYMGNKSFIETNDENENSKVDLEILFNGISAQKKSINNIFNQ